MLTNEQVRQYHDEGYTLVTGLFEQEEIERFRQAFDELEEIVSPVERGKPRLQVEKDLDRGRARLRMIEPLIDLSPTFKELTEDSRIVSMAEDIFCEGAYLFEDKLNYKPARVGSGFPLHQDRSYWMKYSRNLLSFFIHIDDAPLETGPMKLIPGTQKQDILKTGGEGHYITNEAAERDQMLTFESKAGDVLIFHCLTAHESDPNQSDQDRRAIVLSYNPKSDGNQYRYNEELLGTYH